MCILILARVLAGELRQAGNFNKVPQQRPSTKSCSSRLGASLLANAWILTEAAQERCILYSVPYPAQCKQCYDRDRADGLGLRVGFGFRVGGLGFLRV